MVNSGAFKADRFLCVCDGTCGRRKLSRNYTLLCLWPVILLKCSSVKAENFKQRRVKSSAHQSLCDLKYTHTYSTLKYLSVHKALMKVCVGSVTFNLNYQLLDIQVYSKMDAFENVFCSLFGAFPRGFVTALAIGQKIVLFFYVF